MGVDSARYVFRSTWHLPAARGEVYSALVDVGSYPLWWPQVRAARQLDDTSGELCCRSLLPYELSFVVRREVEDAGAGILRAELVGDLTGWSQWTVTEDGAGTVAVFDENVRVGSAMLRAAGRLVRPVLTFNHDAMMRSGERGLRRHLATKLSTG